MNVCIFRSVPGMSAVAKCLLTFLLFITPVRLLASSIHAAVALSVMLMVCLLLLANTFAVDSVPASVMFLHGCSVVSGIPFAVACLWRS
jgi:hypothetical protein